VTRPPSSRFPPFLVQIRNRAHLKPWFSLSALELAALGLPVHPLEPQGKKPLLVGWTARASTDGQKILAWWEKHPSANIGIRCGHGLVVIDVDGPSGVESLADVELPKTATVQTARGHHFYYEGNAQTGSQVLPGVDVRGWGGLVVAPGSLHSSGVLYEWVHHPSEAPIVPLPEDLGALLRPKPARRQRRLNEAKIHEGKRNHTLTRIAGGMRRGGCSQAGLRAALRAENEARCVPPLLAPELDAMVKSIERNWRAGGSPLDKPATFAAAKGDLTLAAKLVLVVLIEHADHLGTVAMGMRRIAKVGGLDLGTVHKAVRLLQREGRVAVSPGGKGKRNSYTITGFSNS
jgi:hypothetical protein